MQELVKWMGSDTNAKIALQAYEDGDGFMPEKGRKVLVHSFIEKKKAQLLKNYKGQPLDEWQYVMFFKNIF